jgi:hypothetical protein
MYLGIDTKLPEKVGIIKNRRFNKARLGLTCFSEITDRNKKVRENKNSLAEIKY